MIEIGQKVRYDPFKDMTYMGVGEIRQIVTGTVTYINYKRGWFMVEHESMKNTFRFTDIGKSVWIV